MFTRLLAGARVRECGKFGEPRQERNKLIHIDKVDSFEQP